MACGVMVAVDCKGTRTDSCTPCGLRYRGRVQRVARVHGPLLMWTLTAPGVRAHSVQSKSGRWVPCPCTARGGTDIARWNAGAGLAFGRLLNNGVRRDESMWWLQGAYFRVVERQDRGALHFHVLVRVRPGMTIPPGALERLTEMAVSYGFGHECDVQEVDAGRGAYYVAKYVGKAANVRELVPWAKDKTRALVATPVPVPTSEVIVLLGLGLDRMTEARWLDEQVVSWVSRTPTYRTWSSGGGWPNTMAEIFASQHHYAAVVAVLPAWHDGVPVGLAALSTLDRLCLPDRPDRPT